MFVRVMFQCNRYHESDKKEKAKEYYEKIKNWLEEKYKKPVQRIIWRRKMEKKRIFEQ